eukprot:Awhi_evm1s9176
MEVTRCCCLCLEKLKVLVDGKEYDEHLCEFTMNSPVFEAMLRPDCFKEGIERKIELPGKTAKQYEILKMALSPQNHLYLLMNLNLQDCIHLLSIVEEYQLNPEIKEFTQQTLSNEKSSIDLLLLAHRHSLGKAFSVHLKNLIKNKVPFPDKVLDRLRNRANDMEKAWIDIVFSEIYVRNTRDRRYHRK